MMSFGPPGGKGTTMRIGRAGQSAALPPPPVCARSGAAGPVAARASPGRWRRRSGYGYAPAPYTSGYGYAPAYPYY